MKINLKNACLAALSLGMLAAPALAGINIDVANAVPVSNDGVTHLAEKVYVDFSASSTVTGHSNWSTFKFPGQSASVKYFTLTAFNPTNSTNGHCIDVATTGTSSTSTSDTQIWVRDDAGVWKSLSNNTNGKFAHARFHFGPGVDLRASANMRIRVAAVNSTHANDHFYLTLTDLGDSMDPCFFDTVLPNALFTASSTGASVIINP
jgi:hypothetical protein